MHGQQNINSISASWISSVSELQLNVKFSATRVDRKKFTSLVGNAELFEI